jgi:class 3 adenylate cyclase
VLGTGAGVPVVAINSWSWTIEMILAQPAERDRLERLGEGRRVITFDRRGIGASQRDAKEFSLDSNVADLAAVAGVLATPKFHLLGYGDGAAVAAAYAATNPDRVAGLVLVFLLARGAGRSDSVVRLIRENWSWARRVFASSAFPNGPIELQRWFSTAVRESMSAEMAVKAVEAIATFNVVDLLPRITAPTLIVDLPNNSAGHQFAGLIPDARSQILRGRADVTAIWEPAFTHDLVEFLDEIEHPPPIPSGLTAILFADIADSTALTERLGDLAFREKARDLDGALRVVIREHTGTPIEGKLLGDGVLAVFTSAKQAIEAALACGKAGDDGGLPLHLGLHAGDVIREENNVYGGAVNIASRISGLSAPGEVLVSDTVRSLARTSAGARFEDRGEQSLKGVGEPVRVWVVRKAE